MKLQQANITVEKEIWEQFKTVTKNNDENASQVLRKFMKQYIKKSSRKKEEE